VRLARASFEFLLDVPFLPTPRAGFRDQPYIEAVHFSNKSCPFIADPFAASFTTTNDSRSEVSFFVDSELPECALPAPEKAFTFLNLNEQCARSVVGGENVIGLTFEPRCVVVTIATRSRRELFDQLLAAGRMLDDPLRSLVNYTTATELDPDVFAASTNCQNSMVMRENYLLDRVLQDEFTQLASVRAEMVSYQQEIEFADFVRDNTRFFQPPSLPPPPPPSPPPPGAPSEVVAVAPPNPPELVTYDVYVQQLNHELAVLQGRERALLNDIKGCESFGGSRTRVCGLSAVEGPNPWIAKNGQPCRGNATLSARFGDFCSYWDSDVRAPTLRPLQLDTNSFRPLTPFCKRACFRHRSTTSTPPPPTKSRSCSRRGPGATPTTSAPRRSSATGARSARSAPACTNSR
jgi:hypothetical protein